MIDALMVGVESKIRDTSSRTNLMPLRAAFSIVRKRGDVA
jgi:hypothetical protein